VILADTSAWIEYLRDTGSPVCERVDELIAEKSRLVTTDPVVMEVLAGAKSDEHFAELRRLLLRFRHEPTIGLADYEMAADIFRRCRRGGETVRVLTGCLIAAVALRTGAAVLHRDEDFDVIARHTGLRLAT
jgi:predicted nucleic acid-binding protein